MMKRSTFSLILAPLCFAALILAQEQARSPQQASGQPARTDQTQPEETVRIRTRLVFVDVLVKDKRTGAPVRDLRRENFQLLDDGKPREISYFSYGDDERRPRSIMIAFDILSGGIRYQLEQQEVREALISVLKQLPPEDEVALAIVSYTGDPDEPCTWSPYSASAFPPFILLQDFTRDRAKLATAIRSILPDWLKKGDAEKNT